jgi:energy-coupling factor transport system ATP-binding protein
MNTIVKFENVSYFYDTGSEGEKTEALKNISLDINKGEFVAVVGHNGSGKSTLAKHINALILPDSGKVFVNDYDTSDEEVLWKVRKSAGMVFQNPDNQIVATIVEEDVAFGPENLGIERDEIRKRVDWALDSVEMRKYAEKAPHMLSGGQKQRVAIAGVIAMHPDIVIMDEPTAMLDPMGRREVIAAAKKLHSEGVTVILITHFMDEAVEADRIIVMNEGKVILNDIPEKIFEEQDYLEELDLTVPPMIKLSKMLIKDGININKTANIDEMAEELCQYLLKN